MGFVTQSEYARIYASIRASSAASSSSTPSVLIFLALDVDAICACKMLTTLLKNDYIPFQVQPVAGYTDLFAANDRLVHNNLDLKTIIFLNLGALTSILPIFYPPTAPDELHSEPRPDLTFYIIDSHRPWDLNNVFLKDGGVFCVDDGDIETGLAMEGGIGEDYSVLLEGDPAYDEDGDAEEEGGVRDEEDEEGEYEDTANENGKRERSRSRSRSRSSDGTASDEDASLTENDTDDEETQFQQHPPRKTSVRPRSSTPPSLPRLSSTAPPDPAPTKSQLRTRYTTAQSRITTYQAQGTTQGQSISSLIYAFLSSLGREDNDALWLAIIGWSSINNHTNNSDKPSRTAELQLWRDEVRRLNPPPLDVKGGATASAVADHSIRAVKDFPFPLLRHWSLYASMLHSTYLCTRLRLYTAKGRTRLDNLLAKMGISQDHARQAWTHTPRDLKKSLREKVDKVQGSLGLEVVDERAWGFERSWGFKGVWSAMDVVGVIEAMIVTTGEETASMGKENVRPVGDGKDGAPGESFRARDGEIKIEWVARFWRALDAVDKVDLLTTNLPAAKSLHRIILSIGQSIIEKRAIKSLRSFRTTILREGPELALLEHPLALSKLATWLCEVSAEEDRVRARRVQRDLIAAALVPGRSVFLVVGVTARPTSEQGDAEVAAGNKFGLAFSRVARMESRGLGMKIDAFEPGVVEVREADLGRFLEVLSSEFARH